METCINYCSTECAYVSSDERHWITTVRKLKEKYPEDVRIIREPKDNDGCIYATVPVKWIKITRPKKMNLTDEQREKIAQRLAYNLDRQLRME